jgi:putative ABC transport system ATP-binding protein
LAEPIIALTDIDLSLGSGAARVHILRGITLSVAPGESVSLVGPSGSGKSTLLMVMAGLERADKGRVVIAGTDLARLGEDALATFRGRAIGIVLQSLHLIPNMTALENVAVPLELAADRNALDRARRELAMVGLADRASHYPAELSGGEQQRVAIARALVAEPSILLADEPTGNLDDTTGGEIADLLFRARAERGTTLVLVTHALELARRSDRVVQIQSGTIAAETAEVARPAIATARSARA